MSDAHYAYVEATGLWRWRWACLCGKVGRAHRSIETATTERMEHERVTGCRRV